MNVMVIGAGKVGGMFVNPPMLLLTTTGAKSGLQRTTPLVYLADGDRFVIIASKGGSPAHPAWYHNLLAHLTVRSPDPPLSHPGYRGAAPIGGGWGTVRGPQLQTRGLG